MKIDIKEEQKRFWETFDEKLIENGEPFSVLHEMSGKVTYWGVVNKNKSFVDNALSMDFLARERKVRINIYVRDNLALFGILERNKNEVESMISVKVNWVRGTKNLNTRRITYELPIDVGNYLNYCDVIDEALPIIVEMKQVCEKYARYEFFDF